jgi:hypothetical protein
MQRKTPETLVGVHFRFAPEIKAALEDLAAKNRRTMTAQLEVLIEAAAAASTA